MLSKIKLLFAVLALSDYCFGQIPILNSSPSITNKVIYLDFDGQNVSGTLWNSGNLIQALPSTMNSSNIVIIWKRMCEDYRPFDVNITTDSVRFNNAPPNKRIRVIVTPTSSWYSNAGGVAYVGSFTWGGTPGTPCWVFEDQLSYNAKNVAEAASHEAGHTLTLKHQSTYDASCNKTNEYNPGQGSGVTSWAPIMGVGYSKNITTWYTGKSTNGCNVIQYDHSNSGTGLTSSGYLSFLADDVGNTYSTAKILNLPFINLVDSGIITDPADIDAYQFTICSNRYVSIGIKPWALDTSTYTGANLDIRFYLYNSSNNVLAVDTPLSKLTTLVGTNLTAGTYYFVIDGGGSANYSDYGSLGKYYISIKATNPPALGNTIITNTNICAGQTTTLGYISNGTPSQWQWNVSGPAANTFTVQNPAIAFNPAGIYTISLLATSSTSLSCATTITLNIGSAPTISLTSGTPILCPGSNNLTLTVSGASSYTWLPGAFGGTAQILNPQATTTYTIKGNNGSCNNSIVTTVSVSPNFTFHAGGGPTGTICPGALITLTAMGASSYTFNPGGITSNPAIFTPTVSTTYSITGSNSLCSKTASIAVNVNPYFSLSVSSSDSSVCSGSPVTLLASGTAMSYTFNPGNITGYIAIVNPTVTTNYTVTATDSTQCFEDSTITVAVKQCDLAGIRELSSNGSIHAYPNPLTDKLIIETNPGNTHIEIYNALGKLIYTRYMDNTHLCVVNTDQWPKGIYILKILSADDSGCVKKIVKD